MIIFITIGFICFNCMIITTPDQSLVKCIYLVASVICMLIADAGYGKSLRRIATLEEKIKLLENGGANNDGSEIRR